MLARETQTLRSRMSAQCLRSQVEAVHHAFARARFEQFISAALAVLEVVPPGSSAGSDGVELLSIAQLSDSLYTAFCHEDEGEGGVFVVQHFEAAFRKDLDLAERLGAVFAAQPLYAHVLVGSSVLRDAADGLLRLARDRFCIRGILIETLTRPIDPRLTGFLRPEFDLEGRDQMLQLLRDPGMGTSNSHFNSLVWFLGRVEYEYCGRLWARFNSSADQPLQDPASPQLLCQMALASELRVATLVDKLFCHSVILRAPVCRLLSDQWPSLEAAAATELLAIGLVARGRARVSREENVMLYALRITKAVLPIAIEQCLMSQPTDAVLLAFREVALSRSRGQEMGTVVYNKLQQLLPCSFCIPTACRLLRCTTSRNNCSACVATLGALFPEYSNPETSNPSWNAFIHRATSSERFLCSLRDLCLDALRSEDLRYVAQLQFIDAPLSLVIPHSNARKDLIEAAETRNIIDFRIERRLAEAPGPVCFQPHDRICNGPLARDCWEDCRAYACARYAFDACHDAKNARSRARAWGCEGGHKWERRDCSSAALNVLFESCPQWVDTFVATTRPNSPVPPMPPDDCADVPIHGDTWHRDPDEHWHHILEWRERQPWYNPLGF